MGVPWLGKAHGVAMDEFGPVLDGDGIGGGVHFVVESLDGGTESATIKFGQDWCGGGNERALILWLFVAHPAEFPADAWDATKGVEHVRRSETGGAGSANAPAAIEEDASFTTETSQEISAAKIGSNHFVRKRGPGDADVTDLMPAQSRAVFGAHDPLLGAGPNHVCFR